MEFGFKAVFYATMTVKLVHLSRNEKAKKSCGSNVLSLWSAEAPPLLSFAAGFTIQHITSFRKLA